MNLALQALRAEAVCVRQDVAEDRDSPQHLRWFHRGNEGHIRAEHNVAIPYASCHKGSLEGVRSIGAGDAIPPASERGKALLQLRHIGAADELGGIQDGLDIGVNLGFQGPVLGF